MDRKGERAGSRFSGAHGNPDKKLTPKGTPKLTGKEPHSPGGSGTPSYVNDAARAAARQSEFNHMDHQVRGGWKQGAPDYTKRAQDNYRERQKESG